MGEWDSFGYWVGKVFFFVICLFFQQCTAILRINYPQLGWQGDVDGCPVSRFM